MASVISASLWEYYVKTDDESKVMCKFCNKLLNSRRNFNLKAHLKQLHKVPVYTEKRPKSNRNVNIILRLEKKLEKLKQLQHLKYSALAESSLETTNEELEFNDTIVKSDYEITEEVPTEVTTINEAAFDYGDDIQHDNSTNVSTRNSTERQVITTIIPDITELSPNFKKNVPLREQPARTKSVVAQPQIRKNTSPPVIDPLEDSGPSTKDDNFDQWVHKKEKLMHLEYLEMRNYKFKLELWEKEQQLRLVSSKYTRDLRNNP